MSKRNSLDIPDVCTLRQCQEAAKRMGYNRVTFDAIFPAGKRRCRWVDAVEGWFEVEGVTKPGFFFQVRDIERMFPGLDCINVEVEPKGGMQ